MNLLIPVALLGGYTVYKRRARPKSKRFAARRSRRVSATSGRIRNCGRCRHCGAAT